MDHPSMLKLHPLTLKFSGDASDLELGFHSENTRFAMPHNRAAIIIAFIFYSSFALLDVLLMPEFKSVAWFIRFAVVDPFFVVIYLITFSRFFQHHASPIMAINSLVAGIGIIIMIITAPPIVNYSYYAGIILVFIWTYTLARISFLWASFAGWLLVALYEVAAIWIKPTPFAILISNNFFFIGANVMGMVACYSLEYYARRDYFMTRQIDAQREKTLTVNRELENQTIEYQNVNRSLEKEVAARRKAEEELYIASIMDPLTGIFNRRFILGRLDVKCKEYRHTGSDFSVTIIDLDFFKKFNDTYGHLAGDFILREFATIMKEGIRPYDLIGRYGGEEYIIISGHVDIRQTEKGMYRLLQTIRDHVFDYHGQELRITFSAGIANSREFADKLTADGLIELADERLYKAKQKGRNRICIE